MEPDSCTLPSPQEVSGLVRACSASSPGFAEALAAGVTPAEVLARLGLHLCRENQVADAVTLLRAAVALEPGNAVYWLNLAVAMDRTGAAAAAAECLHRTLALDEQQIAAWLLLGTVRTKLNDLAGADTAYRTALQLDGQSALAWQCLGVVKQQQGDLTAAVACFTSCLARGGTTAATLANLGKLHYQIGRMHDAADAYAAALALDVGNSTYLEMLRRARFLRDLIAGAGVAEALAAHQPASDLPALLPHAFTLLNGFGHVEAAARVGEKWLQACPTSASANYLLASLTGACGLERSPADYIVEYFDGFAEDFDSKLVNTLRYDLPAQLRGAIAAVAARGQQHETLDLGCGTGLCGPLLRPLSRTLTGVDLSAKMLVQARRRNTYDMLVCAELLAFLRDHKDAFDLIVAADVLIYFGDLKPVWDAARNALRPGGLLAFSTESLAGDGYRLQKSGRFAHSLAYVRGTTEAGFDEHICSETTIRQEGLQPIRGHYFVLRRRDGGR